MKVVLSGICLNPTSTQEMVEIRYWRICQDNQFDEVKLLYIPRSLLFKEACSVP